jgi:hypothetical protein
MFTTTCTAQRFLKPVHSLTITFLVDNSIEWSAYLNLPILCRVAEARKSQDDQVTVRLHT